MSKKRMVLLATRDGIVNRLARLTVAVLVMTLVLAGTASAVPVLVTSRAALGGTDFLDWADAGASPANPFTIVSDGGLSVEVSKPGAKPFRRQNQGSTWFGNFAPGDALLTTYYERGPISLDLANPVFGGGAQIQPDAYGSFTATIEAFDASDASLGSFTLAGDSTRGHDNSAIFLGVLDTSATISRIEIGLTNASDFAINQFDIVNTRVSPPVAVPEPGTLSLFGVGLAAISLLLSRRRRFNRFST